MEGEDPEQRIAELERQLADARRIADLERQLAEARRAAQPPVRDAAPIPPEAWRFVNHLAAQATQTFHQGRGDHEAMLTSIRSSQQGLQRLQNDFGLSQAQAIQLWETASAKAMRNHQFGGDSGGFDAKGRLDTTLAPAPRKVPLAFWLAELIPFRWPYVFAVFMMGILGVSVVSFILPIALPFIAVAAVAGVYAYQLRGTATRTALLKWGVVARVISSRVVTQGTYYSGVTWSNAALPIAHGWKVVRPFYSGPSTTSEIRYNANGAQKTIRVSGREYIDGVILADSRKPERALCVTSFAYDLDRDPSGNWIGKLRPRLVIGMISWVVLLVLFFGLALAVAYYADDVLAAAN